MMTSWRKREARIKHMKDKPLFVVGYFDLDDLDLDEKSP